MPTIPPTPEGIQQTGCIFCQQNLEGNFQQFTCGHRCDIQCLIVETAAHSKDYRDLMCPSCHEHAFDADLSERIHDRQHQLHYHEPLLQELEETNETDTIQQLAQTSAQFKEDLKKMKQIKKEQNEAKKAATQVKKEQKNLWKSQSSTSIALLKHIHKERLHAIQNSSAWKKKVSLFRKVSTNISTLADKYNLSKRKLARFLKIDDYFQGYSRGYRRSFRVMIW